MHIIRSIVYSHTLAEYTLNMIQSNVCLACKKEDEEKQDDTVTDQKPLHLLRPETRRHFGDLNLSLYHLQTGETRVPSAEIRLPVFAWGCGGLGDDWTAIRSGGRRRWSRVNSEVLGLGRSHGRSLSSTLCCCCWCCRDCVSRRGLGDHGGTRWAWAWASCCFLDGGCASSVGTIGRSLVVAR